MSSALDEDTVRTLQSGRQTVGSMLGSAKKHLQKVFIVFVVGLVGTIYVLRTLVWDFLRANTRSLMNEAVNQQTDIIARNPFDVILIQVKIGLFVGVFLSLPLILYYSRDALRERGFTSVVPISRGQQVAFGVLSVVLFMGGVFYSYAVFFPVMFDFLATNAINASIKPSYDIVMYVRFLVLLTVSFGFAAQLPLFMSVLSYTEIVPYETFRDKWKYAVIGIFTFGALFSPPDPFTQIMWAIPLCSLYVFSLGLSKLVTNIRRAGESDPGALTIRGAMYRIAGLFVLAAVGTYLALAQGALGYLNDSVIPQLPAGLRPGTLGVEGLVGVAGTPGIALLSVVTALVVVVAVVFVSVIRVLNQPVVPKGGPGHSPEDIDLEGLTAGGVRAAPPELFEEMDEDEAVAAAGRAMEEEDDPDKAEAILDRFDEIESAETAAEEEHGGPPVEGQEGVPEDAVEGESYDEWPPEEAQGEQEEEEEGLFTSTAAGMADAFSEEETTEEDVGGYYYDLTFIIQSITSKAFRIVGVFMAVLGVSFYWLYKGGLGTIKATFFRQVPPELLAQVVQRGGNVPTEPLYVPFFQPISFEPLIRLASDPAQANYIIALHPVEQLIFEVKVSTIVGAVVAVPLLLYYAWPAIEERGLTTGGDRRVFLVWGGSLIAGVVGGSLLGFFYIAPNIISWLVADALRAGMVISYRLNVFMWMIIFTTVGIGLLADIPVTMVLFEWGGIVSYETMRDRWRVVVLGVFAIAGLVIPGGTLTMFIIALPTCFAFGVGLGALWLLTLPRRIGGSGGREEAAAS